MFDPECCRRGVMFSDAWIGCFDGIYRMTQDSDFPTGVHATSGVHLCALAIEAYPEF